MPLMITGGGGSGIACVASPMGFVAYKLVPQKFSLSVVWLCAGLKTVYATSYLTTGFESWRLDPFPSTWWYCSLQLPPLVSVGSAIGNTIEGPLLLRECTRNGV